MNGIVNHPELSQRLLKETYQRCTGQTVDHSSFSKRLSSLNPTYMEAVFRHLQKEVEGRLSPKDAMDKSDATIVLRLRFVDATIVSLSSKVMQFGLAHSSGALKERGEGRRNVKTVLALSSDGLPDFLRLCKEQAECSDCRATGEAVEDHTRPGDFWVFDRGLYDRKRLLSLHKEGAFFLTPHNQQAFRVLRTLWTEEAPRTEEPPRTEEASFRLLRVEEVVFENTMDSNSPKRQKEWAAMPLVLLHGERYDTRNKQWKPLTLLSNLPLSKDGGQAGPYSILELAMLYKRRWEIETFFKFLKGHLGYDHLVSRNENGITVMVYATLAAALLLIWYRRASGINRGWKAVQFWLAENLRLWTQTVLENAFSPPQQLNI